MMMSLPEPSPAFRVTVRGVKADAPAAQNKVTSSIMAARMTSVVL